MRARVCPQTADLSFLLSANGRPRFITRAQKSNFPSFGLLTYTRAVVVAAAGLRLNSFTVEARELLLLERETGISITQHKAERGCGKMQKGNENARALTHTARTRLFSIGRVRERQEERNNELQEWTRRRPRVANSPRR